MERFDKRFPIAYSPLFTGFSAGLFSFLALCGIMIVSPIATWVYLIVLAGSAFGILLQFTTKRVWEYAS